MEVPRRNVALGTFAGAVVVIINWVLGLVNPDLQMPPTVAAALAVVITTIVAYLVPETPQS